MASFAVTTQKCTVCEKAAYPVDKLTADGRVYHKACFRCHHCRNTLKLSNYCSFEGVLYCRPHYDQLYKRTGSLEKSFEGTPKIQKPERQTENENAKALSNMFLGTKDKCAACKKTVYPTERVSVNGTPYHRGCFKCSHGGCTISSATFITHEGKIYCKHHHIQLFREKGNYSQLDGDKEKNPNNTVDATTLNNAIEDLQRENKEVEDRKDPCDFTVKEKAKFFHEESCGYGSSSPDEKDNDEEHVGHDLLKNASCPIIIAASSPSQPHAFSCSSSPLRFSKANDVDTSDSDSCVEQLSGDPSHGSLSPEQHHDSEKSGEVAEKNGEKEKEAQNLLNKLNFQLLDKNGREVKINVTYRTNEKKKKRAQKDKEVQKSPGKAVMS